MNAPGPHKQGGATRLELAVSTALAALLAGLLLKCIISYQGETEHVAAKQLLGSLRTALAVQSARIISTTGEAGLLALAQQNPMTWLQERPKNYLGEYYSPKNEALPKGHWYFDRSARTLVYLPSSEKSFSSGIQKILVFKVEFIRVSAPVHAGKGIAGLVLEERDEQAIAYNTNAGSLPRVHFSEKK